jgi:ATP-binding protein involved in chromosome partitioning
MLAISSGLISTFINSLNLLRPPSAALCRFRDFLSQSFQLVAHARVQNHVANLQDEAPEDVLVDVALELDRLAGLLLDLPPGTGDVSMTLAQLLPQAKVVIVTTPQPAAQSVAGRAAEMAAKVDLEVLGVIENMSGFTTPDGQRFTIFGEGGGQLLADDLDVPLLGKVPLSEELRAHADTGVPLVLDEPDAPASQAIRAAARGIVAATPQELPVMQAVPAAVAAPAVSGTELPMAG